MGCEPARFALGLEEGADALARRFGFGGELWRFELKCFHSADAVHFLIGAAKACPRAMDEPFRESSTRRADSAVS